MIKVIPFIYENKDDLYANTYVLIDELNQCVVVDPAKAYDGLINYINKNNLTLNGILITHGHADHIRGVDVLVDAFNVPVYIGYEDLDKLTNPFSNCSEFLGERVVVNAKAQAIGDTAILHLLDEDIHVIYTPYHTSGSVCYYLKDSGILFTGDFIIPHGIGRCDLPTAKPREFNNSLSKILALPKETIIYGGHERSSTLQIELRVNQYIK